MACVLYPRSGQAGDVSACSPSTAWTRPGPCPRITLRWRCLGVRNRGGIWTGGPACLTLQFRKIWSSPELFLFCSFVGDIIGPPCRQPIMPMSTQQLVRAWRS